MHVIVIAFAGRKRERTMDGEDDDDCKALMQETESRIKCAKELKMDSSKYNHLGSKCKNSVKNF